MSILPSCEHAEGTLVRKKVFPAHRLKEWECPVGRCRAGCRVNTAPRDLIHQWSVLLQFEHRQCLFQTKISHSHGGFSLVPTVRNLLANRFNGLLTERKETVERFGKFWLE